MIRYDLTMVPTNVGDDVPEEIQPGYKAPPKDENLTTKSAEDVEEKVKKCVKGEDKDCKDLQDELESGALSIISSISVVLATSLMLTLF